MTLGSRREQHSELVERAAGHDRASDQVLSNRLPHEALGGQHPHPALIDIFGGCHAKDAAVMVDMTVGVDHRGHRTLAQRRVRQIETRSRRERCGQRIDNHPPLSALDERDVGDVIATGLPNILGHLEQSVLGVESSLPPQTRVNRRRRSFLLPQKVELCGIPRQTERPVDRTRLVLGDQPPSCPLPVILELERSCMRCVDGNRVIRSRLWNPRIVAHHASMTDRHRAQAMGSKELTSHT